MKHLLNVLLLFTAVPFIGAETASVSSVPDNARKPAVSSGHSGASGQTISGIRQLEVNGNFKTGADGNLPAGWILNKGANYESADAVSCSGNTLRMKSSGKWIHLYYGNRSFDAEKGDKLVFEFTGKGRGSGSAGVYLYHGRGNGAGAQLRSFALKDAPEKFRIELTIRNQIPARPVTNLRPVIAVSPNSFLEISNLSVSVQPGVK